MILIGDGSGSLRRGERTARGVGRWTRQQPETCWGSQILTDKVCGAGVRGTSVLEYVAMGQWSLPELR